MSYKLPKNTCPLIDEVVSFVKSLDYLDFSESERNNSIWTLEEIRTMNSELREWAEKGIEYEDKIEDLEKEIEDLKDELYSLNEKYNNVLEGL